MSQTSRKGRDLIFEQAARTGVYAAADGWNRCASWSHPEATKAGGGSGESNMHETERRPGNSTKRTASRGQTKNVQYCQTGEMLSHLGADSSRRKSKHCPPVLFCRPKKASTVAPSRSYSNKG